MTEIDGAATSAIVETGATSATTNNPATSADVDSGIQFTTINGPAVSATLDNPSING